MSAKVVETRVHLDEIVRAVAHSTGLDGWAARALCVDAVTQVSEYLRVAEIDRRALTVPSVDLQRGEGEG